jgi:hypothetical protein
MVVLQTEVFWVVTCRLVHYRRQKFRSSFIFRTKQSKDSLLRRVAKFSTAEIFGRYCSLLFTAAVVTNFRTLFILGLINKTFINIWRAKYPPTDYD